MYSHELPGKGEFGVGTIFLDPSWELDGFKNSVIKSIEKVGLQVLFWRKVPTNDAWYVIDGKERKVK